MDNWHTELALTFHEETKHSYESVYRDRHFLDWANQPQPFKRYLGLEAIPLPADLPMTQMPALLGAVSAWRDGCDHASADPPRSRLCALLCSWRDQASLLSRTWRNVVPRCGLYWGSLPY